MDLIGEIAALATSFFFAFTSLIFATAGRMVGSQVTNRIRLIFALTYLIILNIMLFHEPLPFSAESSRWIWLSLSGVIGLSLRDSFYFQALISIGPRLGSLLLSLAPIFGSIIAWMFFGETLSLLQITGIVIALAGIGRVIMSHQEPPIKPAQIKLSSYMHHKARQVIRRQSSPRRIVWFSVSSQLAVLNFLLILKVYQLIYHTLSRFGLSSGARPTLGMSIHSP